MDYHKMKGIFVLVILAIANNGGVHAHSTYECWGGCYNNCFMRSGNTKTTHEAESLACHYKCLLNTCKPHSAADFNYYCQIGCSFKLCIPVSYDGAKLERCFGKCTKLCKQSLKP